MLIMPPKSGEPIDMDLQLPTYTQFRNRKEKKTRSEQWGNKGTIVLHMANLN
jgi:hypothetical protein